ncbi:MAG TPA: hypothetical protein VIJ78_05085 [Pseudolabrys sp.]
MLMPLYKACRGAGASAKIDVPKTRAPRRWRLRRHRLQGRLVLAALGESPHSIGMANRNIFAIAGIAIFLMVGVVVAIGVAASIFMVLYGVVVLIFHSAFGIELPHLF